MLTAPLPINCPSVNSSNRIFLLDRFIGLMLVVVFCIPYGDAAAGDAATGDATASLLPPGDEASKFLLTRKRNEIKLITKKKETHRSRFARLLRMPLLLFV
jgi:hypothetical protein